MSTPPDLRERKTPRHHADDGASNGFRTNRSEAYLSFFFLPAGKAFSIFSLSSADAAARSPLSSLPSLLVSYFSRRAFWSSVRTFLPAAVAVNATAHAATV